MVGFRAIPSSCRRLHVVVLALGFPLLTVALFVLLNNGQVQRNHVLRGLLSFAIEDGSIPRTEYRTQYYLDGSTTQELLTVQKSDNQTSKNDFVSAAMKSSLLNTADFSAVEKMCERTEWRDNLVFSCEGINGGIGNVRNEIQNCIRFAIMLGASIILPDIMQRSKEDLSDLWGNGKQAFDYLFDVDEFFRRMNRHCGGMKIWRNIDSIREEGLEVQKTPETVFSKMWQDHQKDNFRVGANISMKAPAAFEFWLGQVVLGDGETPPPKADSNSEDEEVEEEGYEDEEEDYITDDAADTTENQEQTQQQTRHKRSARKRDERSPTASGIQNIPTWTPSETARLPSATTISNASVQSHTLPANLPLLQSGTTPAQPKPAEPAKPYILGPQDMGTGKLGIYPWEKSKAKLHTVKPVKTYTGIIVVPVMLWVVSTYPVCEDSEEFAAAFGSLLPLRHDVQLFASSALHTLSERYQLRIDPHNTIVKDSFLAVHLRTDSDAAGLNWTGFDIQSDHYIELARDRDVGVIYVASGSQDDLDRFIDKAYPIPVTTKFDLLSKPELVQLRNLTWDQQALVDFEVLKRASIFSGITESSFSWSVAWARRRVSQTKKICLFEKKDKYLKMGMAFQDELSEVIDGKGGHGKEDGEEFSQGLWP